MPEHYEMSHTLDPHTLDFIFFNSEQLAEILIWGWDTGLDNIVDELFEKKSLEERKYYPQFKKEIPPDKRDIIELQERPRDFIENLVFMAKEIPEIFFHEYEDL